MSEAHPSAASSPSISSSVNLVNRDRGVWLVKVPKYISDEWSRLPGDVEVARLRCAKHGPGRKAELELELSQATLALRGTTTSDMPRKHKLNISAPHKQQQQSCAIFSEVQLTTSSTGTRTTTTELRMEGKVEQRLEFALKLDKEAADARMRLAMEKIKRQESSRRELVQLGRAVVSYKPVARHKHEAEHERRKKSEGKRLREDRASVQEALFRAFEQHQYYSVKDLVGITRQPVSYLKEILGEICRYNAKNPHKNMWELKPEYRHYGGGATTTSGGKENGARSEPAE